MKKVLIFCTICIVIACSNTQQNKTMESGNNKSQDTITPFTYLEQLMDSLVIVNDA